MRKLIVFFVICMFVLGFSAHLYARSSPTGAKAMVEKAASYLKAQGKEKAFDEFCNTQGLFRKGELYVFVLDMNAAILAHGGKRKMIGKGSFDMMDADGKYFIKEIIEAAKAKDNGWVGYKWTNPSTKKLAQKMTYFQKVNDVIVCCGAYAG
jgi:cytochrome c